MVVSQVMERGDLVVSQVIERGDLAEFGEKNATQMMIVLPIENVGRKII